MRSTLDTAHTVQVTYVIVFFVMYALFVSWIAGVEHGLVEAGDRRGLRRRPAMIFWYFGLALSVVATLALYANALPLRGVNDPVGFIRYLHVDMIFVAIRLAVGCLYVWCAFSVYKAADALRPLRLRPDAAYYMPPPLDAVEMDRGAT